MTRFLRSRRGSELTEAAVTLPIVLLILLGIVQFGVVVYGSQMAKEAARHGARMGCVAQDDPAERAYAAALGFAQTALPIGQPQVSILAPGGVVGSELRVRVSYRIPNFVGGFPGLPDGPYEVFGEATARQEGW
jgi:Flp pilus assembly protein TadG